MLFAAGFGLSHCIPPPQYNFDREIDALQTRQKLEVAWMNCLGVVNEILSASPLLLAIADEPPRPLGYTCIDRPRLDDVAPCFLTLPSKHLQLYSLEDI